MVHLPLPGSWPGGFQVLVELLPQCEASTVQARLDRIGADGENLRRLFGGQRFDVTQQNDGFIRYRAARQSPHPGVLQLGAKKSIVRQSRPIGDLDVPMLPIAVDDWKKLVER